MLPLPCSADPAILPTCRPEVRHLDSRSTELSPGSPRGAVVPSAFCPSTMASLWEALGQPTPGARVPGAQFPAWRSATSHLQAALREHGCTRKVRSWRTLWRAVHLSAPPRFCTWAQLCDGKNLEQLVGALRRGDEDGGKLSLVNWNIRWLVDPLATITLRKKAVVTRWLEKGKVVMLQETHWNPTIAAQWEALFPDVRVVYSPAIRTEAGG